MSKASNREATAYHEAGHAACRLLLQSSFVYVTVKPDPNDGSLGHVMARPFRGDWAKLQEGWRFGNAQARNWAEKQAMISAAGSVAEHLRFGRYNHDGAASDYAQVVSYLEQLSSNNEETGAYWNWIQARTRTLLSRPFHWFIVGRIAGALMERETITYQEAKAIIKRADVDFMSARKSSAPISLKKAKSALN